MVKKTIIQLANGQVITAYQKNVSEGQKFITVKEGVISSPDDIVPPIQMMTTFIPYHRIDYMEEHLVDEPTPGERPQPTKPKVKMWRMGTQEVIRED